MTKPLTVDEIRKLNPPFHPFATPDRRSGAFGMNAGDWLYHSPTGERCRADEFLPDGDAFVVFEDGRYAAVPWAHLSPEPAQ